MQISSTDIDNLSTWVKFSKKLCKNCKACCCSLPVEATSHDLIRMGLMDEFELLDDLKKVARRLKKQKLIDRFHQKNSCFTLTRMANGDCFYLDPVTRKCTIYDLRPDTCRNHPHIGPRPGFCAYSRK